MIKEKRNLNIFYDFEFLEGKQRKYILGYPLWETKPTIDMISLGMVIDDGVNRPHKHYLINKEFNVDEAWNRYDISNDWMDGHMSLEIARQHKVYWLRDNVLKPIWIELEYRDWESSMSKSLNEFKKLQLHKLKFTKRRFKYLVDVYGKSRGEIRTILEVLIDGYDNVSLYGYYSSYDHVLFSWLFGKMVDLPSNVNKYTYDLKPYLNQYLEKFKNDNIYIMNDSNYKLSDVLRFVKKNTNFPKQDPENKHHAQYDAIWIAKLYEFLRKEGVITNTLQ